MTLMTWPTDLLYLPKCSHNRSCKSSSFTTSRLSNSNHTHSWKIKLKQNLQRLFHVELRIFQPNTVPGPGNMWGLKITEKHCLPFLL